MPDTRNELILAQNQHAFIQDETKGLVQVIVGPYKTGLTATDRPVKYVDGKYVTESIEKAVSQNPTVPEGSYLVLENPSEDDKKINPGQGSQAPAPLKTGRKINIPGPATFALWPGQVATAVAGHQLKSNEYIIVRVYNVEEATKNWPKEIEKPEDNLVVGQLLVVEGTEVSFFIPPTGLEVVADPITKTQYVRQAVTLERLEYCVLLDEDGNKRYEKGPQVVFPEATEKFMTKKSDSATAHGEATTEIKSSIKFKATELNDQMGIYVKVIADYRDDINHSGITPSYSIGRPVTEETDVVADGSSTKKKNQPTQKPMFQYLVGDELFITGKVQRIYYPRPEHAIIEYGSEEEQFKRQRYYGIAIPKGEARYVLDKNTGKVELVRGEKVFLPDPRYQVIVRRVLDSKTVDLWYPNNPEAATYNQELMAMTIGSSNYVQETSYNAMMDLARSVNRGTRGTTAMAGGAGASLSETLNRGSKFTQPPSLTLNTKYDGPPTVNVWTGYAVQVVDKSGNRRVVKGPATILLEYDESLEKVVLSSGNPKSTDSLIHDVYLRVDHNKVSDTIHVETKDMVVAKIRVSYRVNFEGDEKKWFSVENYVKFMCDHCRSLLRAEAKKKSIKELIDTSTQIVRDTILGAHTDKKERAGRIFTENGMRIYDVEVLKTEIEDAAVDLMLKNNQKEAVSATLILTAKQQEVENTKLIQTIEQNIAQLKSNTQINKIELDRRENLARHNADVKTLEEKSVREQHALSDALKSESLKTQITSEENKQTTATNEIELIRLEKETAQFLLRMGAVNPKLATALEQLAGTELMSKIMSAVAPIAVMEQQGVGPVIERLLEGTTLLDAVKNMNGTTNGKAH